MSEWLRRGFEDLWFFHNNPYGLVVFLAILGGTLCLLSIVLSVKAFC